MIENLEINEAFHEYLGLVLRLNKEYYEGHKFTFAEPVIEFTEGPRYMRVIKAERYPNGSLGSRCVHSFVDKETGDILKGSWKAPVAKGVRGNILTPDRGASAINHHGPNYL